MGPGTAGMQTPVSIYVPVYISICIMLNAVECNNTESWDGNAVKYSRFRFWPFLQVIFRPSRYPGYRFIK